MSTDKIINFPESNALFREKLSIEVDFMIGILEPRADDITQNNEINGEYSVSGADYIAITRLLVTAHGIIAALENRIVALEQGIKL